MAGVGNFRRSLEANVGPMKTRLSRHTSLLEQDKNVGLNDVGARHATLSV